jgi:hypothetical protein
VKALLKQGGDAALGQTHSAWGDQGQASLFTHAGPCWYQFLTIAGR